MKKVLTNAVTIFLVIGAGAVVVLEGMTDDGLKVGSEAPPFDFEQLDGTRVSSVGLHGKVVLLDFWATWCPPCREEMPWLADLGKEYAAKGVRLVAASRDDEEEWRDLVRQYVNKQVPGLEPYAAGADPFTAGKYRVDALPTLYVIGKDGKIFAGVRGSTSEWRVKRWLDRALAE